MATTVIDKIQGELRRFMSEIIASSIVKKVLTSAAFDPLRERPGDQTRLQIELDRAVRLFVADAHRQKECQRAIKGVLASHYHAHEQKIQNATILIEEEPDIVLARQEGMRICATLGFSLSGQVRVATVISELARNIVQYAQQGFIELRNLNGAGIEIIASDQGPGIDEETLLHIQSGTYRSRTGLGLGLRGARNLVDEFNITSLPGKGTRVVARKKLVL